MSSGNIWGSVGSMAEKFMSSFGNGVSKGMNATVAAVSDGISAINEEFFQDGEEHYFEEDRSVVLLSVLHI
jgi:singapore isolate B (sub-type 7) whole genome shotgun sequence assembly, scaffold_21